MGIWVIWSQTKETWLLVHIWLSQPRTQSLNVKHIQCEIVESLRWIVNPLCRLHAEQYPDAHPKLMRIWHKLHSLHMVWPVLYVWMFNFSYWGGFFSCPTTLMNKVGCLPAVLGAFFQLKWLLHWRKASHMLTGVVGSIPLSGEGGMCALLHTTVPNMERNRCIALLWNLIGSTLYKPSLKGTVMKRRSY